MRGTPKNWSRHQHYKTRRPPWIKLHRSLLDDPEWGCLQLASKALAPQLWLLASEHGAGEIDLSPDLLAWRLRCSADDVRAGLAGLIDGGWLEITGTCEDDAEDASNMLAPCLHDASNMLAQRQRSEAKVEVEAKAETPLSSSRRSRPATVTDPRVLDVVAAYRRHHPRALPKPSETSREVRAIRARLAEGYDTATLCAAIDGMHRTPHNMGDNERGQKYLSLELCLRSASQVDRFAAAPLVHRLPPSRKEREIARALDDFARDPDGPGDAWDAPAQASRVYDAPLVLGASDE